VPSNPSTSICGCSSQGLRDGDVELGGQVRLDLAAAADPDYGLGVALVGDLVERQVSEEPGGLGGVGLHPLPGVVVVQVRCAVRLGSAEHRVVQAPEVDPPVLEAQFRHWLGEPAPVPVPGRGVEPERVVLRREDG
jgi:hypothetical protein